MEDDPKVELSFEFMWCSKHLEPFRANWPNGAPLAMVNLFQASSADKRIVHAARGDLTAMTGVLREHGPMCCFLPPAVVAEVVKAALEGRVWPGPTPKDIEQGRQDPYPLPDR